jgi:hypothetical protein
LRGVLPSVLEPSMAGDKIPPNGTPPLLNLQNVQMNTEPNRPAVAVENALSEIRIHPHNLDKADQCLATFRNPGSFFRRSSSEN